MIAIGFLMFLGCKAEPAPKAAVEEKAAPAREAEAKAEASPDFASAFQHAARWDAAKKALVVDVTVAPGFHAYTTGETTGKPLLVDIAADSDFSLTGAIEYPKGVEKTLPLGRSVIVEGAGQIVAPLAPKTEAAGPKKATGSLRYQVCTEKACDRPRTAPLAVDVAG